MFKKIINNFKNIKQINSVNINFWNEISNNPEILNFFNKNNFTYSINDNIFGDMEFFKIGIIDNTLLLYPDENEIKNVILSEYQDTINKLSEKLPIDLEKYYTLDVRVIKFDLMKFNPNIFNLKNGSEIEFEQVKANVNTNLLSDINLKEVVNKSEIYVYIIEFYYNELPNIVKLRNKVIKFMWRFAYIFTLITFITLFWILKFNKLI